MVAKTKAWGIVQGRMLFYSVGRTKADAIADYVGWSDQYLYENHIFKPNGAKGRLSYRQREVWAEAETRGCKAIRVLITEDPA
jgi:hypothetical protein